MRIYSDHWFCWLGYELGYASDTILAHQIFKIFSGEGLLPPLVTCTYIYRHLSVPNIQNFLWGRPQTPFQKLQYRYFCLGHASAALPAHQIFKI